MPEPNSVIGLPTSNFLCSCIDIGKGFFNQFTHATACSLQVHTFYSHKNSIWNKNISYFVKYPYQALWNGVRHILTGVLFHIMIPLKDKFYKQPEIIQTSLARWTGSPYNFKGILSEQELKEIDWPAKFMYLCCVIARRERERNSMG